MTKATKLTGFQLHMQERRELVDYPGYFVSREGKVYDAEGKERKQYMSGIPAYKYVSLPDASAASGWQIRRVHILVAKAFVPNPENLPVVNHIDEDKLNCVYTNLQWCTVQQNVRHSVPSWPSRVGIPRPTYTEQFQRDVVSHYVKQVNKGKKSKRAVYKHFGISAHALDCWIDKWMIDVAGVKH